MKILFICHANVGRSQMAMAYYNQMTNSHDAHSAGTRVDYAGETLGARKIRRGGTFVIDAMKKDGIDISKNLKMQLTEDHVKEYDLLINMAEPENTQEWLFKSPKHVFWDIDDPGHEDMEKTIEIRDKIKGKVAELLNI